MEYKSNRNIVYSCRYHVVFCPKYRRKLLMNGIDTRLKELVVHVCEKEHIDLLKMVVMPDHVYLLLDVDPQYGINRAVKQIKGVTSHVLRDEFPWIKSKVPTLWTNSYFVSTAESTPLSAVRQYIENQKTSQRQKEKMG